MGSGPCNKARGDRVTTRFDWDEANLAHVARHGLTADDCERALADPQRISRPVGQDRGEPRVGMIGATEAARLIIVIYTFRIDRIRVVTAFPANADDLRAYQEVNQ
jgi:uncharacterized DUF497 family protein